jgi:lysophospholipase L1-like esterase
MKARPVLLRLATATASVLATLLLLELGLRLVHPVGLHPSDTFLATPAGAGDPEAGIIRLVPGAATRYRSEEFNVAVRINARGLRDREFSLEKAPGVTRILVLGDSQTFGWGVEAEQTYPKLVERQLAETNGAAGGGRVEAINAAVPGTGTAHQLYFLETEGWEYHPDLVIVGFFFNDLNDSALCQLYGVSNGRLVRRAEPGPESAPFPEGTVKVPDPAHRIRMAYAPAAPAPPEPSFWVRHFHLVRFARESLARLRGRSPVAPLAAATAPSMRGARALTAHLLQEMDRQCREHRATLLVVLIPSHFDCKKPPPGGLRKALASVLQPLPDPDRQVLDLSADFNAAGCRRMFFPEDKHLSPAGHQVVAAGIVRALRQQAVGTRQQAVGTRQ